MDIIIPYKKTNDDSLRYCLRSLKNIDHDKVFICGDKPDFISSEVIYLPRVENGINAQHDSELNIRLALADGRLSENFILFNDDFFILKKAKKLEYDNGYIADIIKERKNIKFRNHNKHLIDTEKYLLNKGYTDIKSYELHIPMVMNKDARQYVSDDIIKMLEKNRILLPRTIYGNIFYDISKTIKDVKIYAYTTEKLTGTYLSTLNLKYVPSIEKRFKEKCRYEL